MSPGTTVRSWPRTELRVKDLDRGTNCDIEATGFFEAIGNALNTGAFEGQLDMGVGFISIPNILKGIARARKKGDAWPRQVRIGTGSWNGGQLNTALTIAAKDWGSRPRSCDNAGATQENSPARLAA